MGETAPPLVIRHMVHYFMADPILIGVHITGDLIDKLARFHLTGYDRLNRNSRVDIADKCILEGLPPSADPGR